MYKPTSRDTKAKILSAWKDLYSDYQKLEKELKSAKSSRGAAPVAAAPKPKPKAAAASSVDDATVSAIVANLGALQGSFGGAVSSLSADLTQEAVRLAELRADAEEIIEGIKELHDVDVADDPLETLSDLIQKYEAAEDTFNTEFQAKKDTHAEELDEKRSAWNKEQDEHSSKTKERDSELRKARRRESAEYDYELEQKRKLESESYDIKKRGLRQELDAIVEGKEKTWAERETEVSEREGEYAETKQKHDGLKEQLDAAVKKSKDEGAAIARNQARTKADLVAKEIEGQERLFKLRISSLEATIQDQASQIERLSQQLKDAQTQAQDLAVKAIEGPSHAASFKALKEIALEQARGQQKGK